MIKPRSCQYCKHEFTPDLPKQRVCDLACAVALATKKRAKIERAEDKVKLEKIKTRAQWVKEAQVAFNRYIRLRDANEPCISCGQSTGAKMNAGHYLSTGARPELRFNELNCHKQCEKCNSWLSGNAVMYRTRLIDKIGMKSVLWLEGHHEPKKYSIEDLKSIKAEYTRLVKEFG
jgi:hypothetical protein